MAIEVPHQPLKSRSATGRVAAAPSLHCYTSTISGENGVFGAVGRVQAGGGYLGQGGDCCSIEV